MTFPMRRFFLVVLLMALVVVSCVDPLDQTLIQRVDVVVIDGTITNLNELQVVYLNRSKSDPLTGRFGTLPLTKATVNIVVDSVQVVPLRETEPGRYQAPDGFTGQVDHAYQLRFTLTDGSRYESAPEIMPAVPPIANVTQRFNLTTLPAQQYDGSYNAYRGANEFFVNWQDPADQHNYYRWDWRDYEKQDWCHTCTTGFYYVNSPINGATYEDCYPGNGTNGYFVNDYSCRTPCWEIVRNYDLNVFDDRLSNGGMNTGRRVAQIPYYQDRGALVEIRQSSLTAQAYRYYKLAQEQSQNNGGIADPPPTALVGNIKNVANVQERVVGYFGISAVAPVRYWLDRKENTGPYPGLFRGINGILPSPEGAARDPNTDLPKPNVSSRPTPTAVCVESDTRTQTKPVGWQD